MDTFNSLFFFSWNLPVNRRLLQKGDVVLTPRIRVSNKTQLTIKSLIDLDLEEGERRISHAYPGFGLPGYGVHHRLLIGSSTGSSCEEVLSEMWNALGLLRLIRPLFLDVCGGALVTTEWEKTYYSRIRTYLNPFEYLTGSHRQSMPELEYDVEEVQRFRDLWGCYERTIASDTFLGTAIRSFIRTTLTEELNFSETFFQKLFPILDCLSGNPNHKHGRTISKSLGTWLQHIYKEELKGLDVDFTKAILAVWDSFRHHYCHLSHSLKPPSLGSMTEEPLRLTEALYALHEICRLVILSLLSLPDIFKEELEKLPKVGEWPDENKAGRRDAFDDFYANLSVLPRTERFNFWEPSLHGPLFKRLQ